MKIYKYLQKKGGRGGGRHHYLFLASAGREKRKRLMFRGEKGERFASNKFQIPVLEREDPTILSIKKRKKGKRAD